MANRKTSGRYRLVLLNESKREIPVCCDSLSGKILPMSSGKEQGADLAVLDLYILENVKDEADLLRILNNLGYPMIDGYEPKFAYQHHGVIRYLDLIYSSEELHTLAQICHQYKKQFSLYGNRNHVSSKQLRKLISGEIRKEIEWKRFYQGLLEDIHDMNFRRYLQNHPILGDRALGYIDDYLNNEFGKTRDEKEAFHSAEYYLMDTFTAYKPIRGMILCKQKYMGIFQNEIEKVKEMPRKLVNPFTLIDPFSLISELQLGYLEDHASFNRMTRKEQEDIILDGLGLTRRFVPINEAQTEFEVEEIPWHERTLIELSEAQILYLESHPNFEQLSYMEKIRFADSISTGGYQKKKV